MSDAADGRIEQLDRLRGISILGIFFMNIPFMAGSANAYLGGRYDWFGWSTADRVAFFLQEVLAEGTARGLLQMLFGAGMVILTARFAATMTGWGSFTAYYRRYIILFLFGVVHIFAFLWVGDILSIYGPAALLLYWFRNRSAKTMLAIGLLIGPIFFAAGMAADSFFQEDRGAIVAAAHTAEREGRPLTERQREAIEAEREEDAAPAELAGRIRTERAARLGGYAGYAEWNRAEAVAFVKKGFHPLMVLEALATMLIGAALFKMGVLQGGLTRGGTVRLTIVAYAVGLAIRIPIAVANLDVSGPESAVYPLMEFGRLAMVIGHFSLVAVIANSAAGARLLAPFVGAGRVALSLYLLQTLVGMWLVFPGFALGLWGQLGWAGMMMFAAAFSIVQLAIAGLYLRHYRTGPVEWLWRVLAGARPGSRAPDGAAPLPA